MNIHEAIDWWRRAAVWMPALKYTCSISAMTGDVVECVNAPLEMLSTHCDAVFDNDEVTTDWPEPFVHPSGCHQFISLHDAAITTLLEPLVLLSSLWMRSWKGKWVKVWDDPPIFPSTGRQDRQSINQSINQNSLSSRTTSRLIIKLTHDDVRVWFPGPWQTASEQVPDWRRSDELSCLFGSVFLSLSVCLRNLSAFCMSLVRQWCHCVCDTVRVCGDSQTEVLFCLGVRNLEPTAVFCASVTLTGYEYGPFCVKKGIIFILRTRICRSVI